jgi:ATP-dependent exoDNAse (exonuclease V) alpha subunit
MSLVRHQVPLAPAWAVTEYKAQGSTYDVVVVDLHWQKGSRSSHKKYCSAYVQLSRARSFDGLFLLQPVTLEDFNGKPDKLLLEEDHRIAELAASTDAAWRRIETSPAFH